MAAGFTPISSSASTTAMCASPRAPPAPSASAKVFMCGAPARPPRGELPGRRGERPHHLRAGGRVLVGRGAVAHAPDDALQDRGEAEEIVGRVDVEVRPRIEAGARDVGFDVLAHRRNAERSQVEPDQRADARARSGGMCHCISDR